MVQSIDSQMWCALQSFGVIVEADSWAYLQGFRVSRLRTGSKNLPYFCLVF